MDVTEESKDIELKEEKENGTTDTRIPDQQDSVTTVGGLIEETKEEAKVAPNTLFSGSTSPHRPLTRSQTGTVSKRRKRDDSEDLAATKKRTPVSRKKQKSLSASASASGTESASAPPEERSQSPRPPSTREGSTTSVSSGTGGNVSATDNGQIKFYHASPTSEDQAQPECRLPRSRASLPTPIPNLTKKSRGRRVPTQASGIADADQKDHRLYVCTVTGCGKCFHRGEHLKRHIRSIHTHEKPFKCTFPLCQKFFNRHDNLLQHLKVHRDLVPSKDSDRQSAPASAPPAASAPSPPPRRATASPPDAHHRRNRERSYSPAEEREPQPLLTTALNNTIPRTIYNAFPMSMPMPSYHAHPLHHLTAHHEHSLYAAPLPPFMSSYGSISDTINRSTNMAVSSLRTELPHSPSIPSADMRYGALQSGPY